MKLEFVKDGQLQGWVTATAFTAITIILLLLGFLFDAVAERWKVMGDKYESIYLYSLGIFLGLRTIKPGVQAAADFVFNKVKKKVQTEEEKQADA